MATVEVLQADPINVKEKKAAGLASNLETIPKSETMKLRKKHIG